MSKKTQQRLFVLATNTMLDFAFAIAYFAVLVLLWIFGMNRLEVVWRVALGLGIIPPLLLTYFRLKMKEPEAYRKHSMKNAPIPYWLLIKRYWVKLLAVSYVMSFPIAVAKVLRRRLCGQADEQDYMVPVRLDCLPLRYATGSYLYYLAILDADNQVSTRQPSLLKSTRKAPFTPLSAGALSSTPSTSPAPWSALSLSTTSVRNTA